MKLSKGARTKLENKLTRKRKGKDLLVEVEEDGSVKFYETEDDEGNPVNHKQKMLDRKANRKNNRNKD